VFKAIFDFVALVVIAVALLISDLFNYIKGKIRGNKR
jgi:hypothetical protein